MLASEELRTFLAVVRSGSLLKAAEVVHASQSTVSYRIQQLERQLGFQVLRRARGSRAVALTADGSKLLVMAERWEALNDDIDRLRYQDDIHVAIGFADVLAHYLFQDFFTALAKKAPAVRFEIETGRSWDMAEKVATGRLDSAFTVFEVESEVLETIKIADYPLVTIASPGLSAARQGTADAMSLPPECEIWLDWGPRYESWRHQNELSRAPSRVDKAQHLLALMKSSHTWSTVPDFMVGPMENAGCRIISGPTPPPSMGVYRLQRKSKLHGNRRQVELIDSVLAETLKGHPPVGGG